MYWLTRTGRVAACALFATVVLASLLSEAVAAIPAAPVPTNRISHPAVARLLNEAQVALATGELRRALVNLKLAAGMEPNNPIVIERLGLALMQSGDYAGAEEQLRYARSLGAPDARILGPLFEAMLALGKNQEVLDLFADPGPTNHGRLAATILRARASAYQSLGNAIDATSAINRALAIERDPNVLMTAARIALAQGKTANAQSLSDEALRLSPNYTDAHVFKIGMALAGGDLTGALSLSEKLVADEPRSLVARLVRVKVYFTIGRPDKAKPDVDRILRETPGLAIAIYDRALILAREKKPAAAWTVAHVLPIEFLQSDSEVAINVAEMAEGAGFVDSAASLLTKAVFKNPLLLDARLKLAEIRLRQNSPQYALNALALVEDSKDPRVSLLFAEANLKLGHRDQAQKYIDRAIVLGGSDGLSVLGKDVALKSLKEWLQRHPSDLTARRSYALQLLRFGDLPNAKIQYELLIRLEPNNGMSFNNLSWLVAKADARRAIELAARAVKLDPTSPDFLDTLGCMQMSQSDFKSAIGSLQRAHALRTDDPEISYHLAMALGSGGDRAGAKTLLAKIIAQGRFADFENAKKLLASWR